MSRRGKPQRKECIPCDENVTTLGLQKRITGRLRDTGEGAISIWMGYLYAQMYTHSRVRVGVRVSVISLRPDVHAA